MKKKKSLRKKSNNIDIATALERVKLDEDRKNADIKDFEINEKSIIDDFESQLSSNEPIRELLSGKNVRFKTQLTEEQRNAVAILYGMYNRCTKLGIEFDVLKNVLDEYIDFGVSIDRKSRTEFVDAQKASQPQYPTGYNQQGMNQQQQFKV